MPGCDACEFRDRPEECHALATGHAPFCDLIRRGREDYRDLVRRLTLGLPRQATTTPAAAPAAPKTPAPAFDPDAHRRVLACKVRQSPRGCGCDGRRLCHRAGLPIVVDLARCLDCVRRSSPA